MLLIQSWFPYEGIWLGFNGVTWYISTLLFIVAIEPFIYKLFSYLKDKKWDKVSLVVICILEIFLALLVKHNETYWLYAFPPVRVLDYLCGMIIGNMYKEKKSAILHNADIKEFVCVIGFVLLMFSYHIVDEGVGRVALYLPFVCYSIYLISFEAGFISKLLKKLAPFGKYTLTLYIVHQVVVNYVRRIEIFIENDYMKGVGVIVSLVGTILCAICFEKIYHIGAKKLKRI